MVAVTGTVVVVEANDSDDDEVHRNCCFELQNKTPLEVVVVDVAVSIFFLQHLEEIRRVDDDTRLEIITMAMQR